MCFINMYIKDFKINKYSAIFFSFKSKKTKNFKKWAILRKCSI